MSKSESLENAVEPTPGPWEYQEATGWIVAPNPYGKGSMHIADVRGWGHLTGHGHGACGMSEEQAVAIQEANGRLLASAASKPVPAADVATVKSNTGDEGNANIRRGTSDMGSDDLGMWSGDGLLGGEEESQMTIEERGEQICPDCGFANIGCGCPATAIHGGELNIPKDMSFAAVNEWVSMGGPSIDEVGWMCLSLAKALENASKPLASPAPSRDSDDSAIACQEYRDTANKFLAALAASPVTEPTLDITFSIPDGMSDEDAIEHVKRIILAMDELHRANGGHGIKIAAVKATGTLMDLREACTHRCNTCSALVGPNDVERLEDGKECCPFCHQCDGFTEVSSLTEQPPGA
jgi:hypothetical protein